MPNFANLTEFAEFLSLAPERIRMAETHGLEHAARIIETEAKGEIGQYQSGIGNIKGWEQLADATQDERVAKGYTANDPLLRTGELRASIQHDVEGRTAVVGTDDPAAEYLEYGTSKMPPRSFLRGSALRKGEEAADAIGKSVFAGIIGASLPDID